MKNTNIMPASPVFGPATNVIQQTPQAVAPLKLCAKSIPAGALRKKLTKVQTLFHESAEQYLISELLNSQPALYGYVHSLISRGYDERRMDLILFAATLNEVFTDLFGRLAFVDPDAWIAAFDQKLKVRYEDVSKLDQVVTEVTSMITSATQYQQETRNHMLIILQAFRNSVLI